MDKLRKVGDWIWRNKERVFFAIMVLILVVRIYLVFNPPPPRPFPNFPPANRNLPADLTPVPTPTPPPEPDIMASTERLLNDNPFNATGATQQRPSDGGALRPNLAVEQVFEIGTSVRVRFKNQPRMYGEGEEIDGFTIRRIDASNSSVQIAKGSDRYTVTPQGTS